MFLCVQSALEVYKEMVLLYLEEGRREVNTRCADVEPLQIIAATVVTTLGAVWIKGFLFQQESERSHVYESSEPHKHTKTGLEKYCVQKHSVKFSSWLISTV